VIYHIAAAPNAETNSIRHEALHNMNQATAADHRGTLIIRLRPTTVDPQFAGTASLI
jgi:hypothetical protein